MGFDLNVDRDGIKEEKVVMAVDFINF